MVRRLLVALIVASLAVLKGVAGTHPDETMRDSGIRATEIALQAFHEVSSDSEILYEVPSGARPLLTKVKHELRDLMAGELNSEQHATPGQLTADILNKLSHLGVPVGAKNLPKSQAYGGILSVEIRRPSGYPQLLAATTTLQLPCSEGDTSLYIFKETTSNWKLVMSVERNGYAQVNGGRDGFSYSILTVRGGQTWYVVTGGAPAWCTSCWGGVEYMVLQPGPTSESYKILRKGVVPAHRCSDPPFELTPTPGGFDLKYAAGEVLDFSLFTTPHTDHFVVSGDEITRIGPLGSSPQDFLNTWVQLPWTEAARWTNPKNLTSLEKWHRQLQPNSSYLGRSKFLFVKVCNQPPSKWQVVLARDSGNISGDLFFTISKNGDTHLLDSIDTARPRGCVGKALPIKASNWNSPSEE